MTKNDRNTGDAELQAELQARVEAARALLREIDAQITRIVKVENPNWAHAGDLGRLIQDLRDAAGTEART